MRTWLRGKVTLLFMTLGMLLAFAGVALADNTIADGDGLAPIADQNMSFGNVACGVASNKTALIAITRQGSGTQVFKNGSTPTVTVLSVTGPGLSAQMGSPNTITLPSNWDSLSNGTRSDSVSSTVTVNSSVPGPGSGSVTYRATGVNSSNGPVTREDTMNVSWTTGSCDTTAPSVTSIKTADANPTNTTGNLSWNVTFSESVTGVDAADFALANNGLGGSPAISNVSGSGANYIVTASSGSGNGTLGLNLTDNDSIKDGANNLLGGTGLGNANFTGEVYVIDRTAPTATGTAVVGPNFTDPYTENTWTNRDVRVTFTCADNTGGSGLTSTSGNQVLPDFTTETSASGATASFSGTCTDNAGNTAAAATFGPIKIDKSNPTINGSASPAPNANGWNNTEVDVTFDCADALSEIATCLGNTTLSSEGADQSVQGTATDNAGNSANATVSNIDIDLTDPNVNCDSAPSGWSQNDVSIHCSASDALSDLADSNDASFNLSTSVDADTETSSAETNSRNVLDNADNSTTADPITGIKVDKKAPVLTDEGPSTSPDGDNGWYKSAVTNGFKATDGGSGFAPSGDLTKSFTKSSGTNEGGAVKIASDAVSDAVGNSAASIDSAAFKIDLSDPTNVTFEGGPPPPARTTSATLRMSRPARLTTPSPASLPARSPATAPA
jgi:hypothetical protein